MISQFSSTINNSWFNIYEKHTALPKNVLLPFELSAGMSAADAAIF